MLACFSPIIKDSRVLTLIRARVEGKVPSLKGCNSLKVKGPVIFADDVTFKGDVSGVCPPTLTPPCFSKELK